MSDTEKPWTAEELRKTVASLVERLDAIDHSMSVNKGRG